MRALERAFRSAARAGVEASAVLYDDGSTDGTADSVVREFGSRVRVLHGDGSRFWAASMAEAERSALDALGPQSDALLLWLNDDVVLDEDAIERLVEQAADGLPRVIVGAVRDPDSATTTYGGLRRAGAHPLGFSLVEPGAVATPVDAMNGNVVLLRAELARDLGGIDGHFSHALADIDYAARATRRGVPVVLAPGTFGTCPRNPPRFDRTIWQAWRAHIGIKGGAHPESARRILRRLAPYSWGFWWAASYALWWVRAGLAALRRTVS